MEIISYFDSKSSFSLPTTPTLEEMLGGKIPRKRVKASSQKVYLKKDVKEKSKKTTIHLLDVLCMFLLKVRYVVFGVCAVLFSTVIVLFSIEYIQSFASPLNFQEAALAEEEILESAMHSFATIAATSHVYEEEAMALIEMADTNALYSQPVRFTEYTVKSGDSIHTISNRFGLQNISTLIGINDIDNARLLQAGQKIIVPSVDGLTHAVKSGESLDSIATHYSISIEEILDVNELDSAIIHIGETLFIPGARLDTTVLRQAMGELFRHPLAGGWRLSSNYGYRADPFTGVRSFHTGADFAIAEGTPVRAAMSGTVVKADYSSIYGYYVIVNHGNEYQTLYAHFVRPAPVKVGQAVTQSSVIGYVGSTGYSTGNHLHFTVYKNGKLVDPRTVIKY